MHNRKHMADVILDAFIDSLKILAVVAVFTYIIAAIEPILSDKIRLNGKLAPLIGVSISLLPQCGFSVVATDLYKKRHITVGTLIGVYLATSDEAIPIFLSYPDKALHILPILALKFVLGVVLGYLIDFVCVKSRKSVQHHIEHCNDEYRIRLMHCDSAELVVTDTCKAACNCDECTLSECENRRHNTNNSVSEIENTTISDRTHGNCSCNDCRHDENTPYDNSASHNDSDNHIHCDSAAHLSCRSNDCKCDDSSQIELYASNNDSNSHIRSDSAAHQHCECGSDTRCNENQVTQSAQAKKVGILSDYLEKFSAKTKKRQNLDRFLVHPLLHSLEIFLYVLVVNIIFGIIIYYIGEDKIISFLSSNKYIAPLFSVIIGAVPNCVSSIVLSELYIMGGLGFGATLGGLCMNAGLGFMLLFRDTKHIGRSIMIFFATFAISIITAYTLSFIFSFSTPFAHFVG